MAWARWIGVLLNLQCWDSLMSIKSYFPMTLWDQKWQFQFNDGVWDSLNFRKSLAILKKTCTLPPKVYSIQWTTSASSDQKLLKVAFGWWIVFSQTEDFVGLKRTPVWADDEQWSRWARRYEELRNSVSISFWMPSKYPLSLFFFLVCYFAKVMTSLWFQPGMDNLKWVFVAAVISLKFSERKQYSDSGADSSSSCEQGKTTCRHTGSTGSAGDSPGGSCTCSRRWCSGSRAGSDGFPHTRPHLKKKAELRLSHISAYLRGIFWSNIYQHMNVKGNFSKTSDT